MRRALSLCAVVVSIGVLAACGSADDSKGPTESSESSTSPLVQKGGTGGLVGTYDGNTGNVWMTSGAVKGAEALAAKQGVTHPLIVVVDTATGVSYPYSRETGTVAIPASLPASATLGACVIDAQTAKRWRFATFRVGGPEELTSHAFVPTELLIEDGGRPAEMCWPAKAPC